MNRPTPIEKATNALVAYIDALFVSGNDVGVQRAWINDDSWAIIKECLEAGLPLDYHVVEAEAVYRRKLASYGSEVRARSPLQALIISEGLKTVERGEADIS